MSIKSKIKINIQHYKKYFFYKTLQKTSRFKHVNEYGAIFIHIPKAAGTSIYTSLFGTLGGGHMSAKRYKIMFGPMKFNAYYKFTFVRNPYDRVLSAYNFLKKGGMNSYDKKFADTNIIQYKNFDDFVINGLNVKKDIQNWIHFVPQYKFLMIDNDINGIFIGKLENIDQDFKYISNVLGIKAELKKTNSSNTEINYKEFYRNDEVKQIIERIYEKDLQFFDYKF